MDETASLNYPRNRATTKVLITLTNHALNSAVMHIKYTICVDVAISRCFIIQIEKLIL